jgi:LysM repeat protein
MNGQGTLTYIDGSKYVGQWKNNSYIKNPKGNETHKILPKKMAEEKSQKAESSKSSKVSEKTTNKRFHTVRAGETLYSISRRHNLTVQKIRLLNKLNNSSVIHPGQKLLLTL